MKQRKSLGVIGPASGDAHLLSQIVGGGEETDQTLAAQFLPERADAGAPLTFTGVHVHVLRRPGRLHVQQEDQTGCAQVPACRYSSSVIERPSGLSDSGM